MKLYAINWEGLGGEEYTELVAASYMSQERAERYALGVMRRQGEGFKYDPSDVENLNFYEVSGVSGLNPRDQYTIAIEKV